VYGARPVERAIQQNAVNQLSKEILAGRIDREHLIEQGEGDKGKFCKAYYKEGQ
jgi:ATP-dependent Clp protease ATP-binding subunit ClpA